MTSIYDAQAQLKNCALELFVGDCLGEGSFRRTYALKQDPSHVLKLQYGPGHDNALEWELWHAVKDTKWAKWFAPCERIDSWGSALIMRRAEPFENERDFLAKVKRVPSFFDDVKWSNWGMLDGRPVCVDYGITFLFKLGLEGNIAMKKTAGLTNP